jgi:hypothetical protein
MTLDLKYTKYVNKYDPVSVSWSHEGKAIDIDFMHTISALFSDKLKCVVVEIYDEGIINFYSLSGVLVSSEPLPHIQGYQFRGMNRNSGSKTGIAFLFNPVDESVGNEWRDIEQYELTDKPKCRLGKKLGIFR